ncbi:hypothetical protein JHL18_21405 [Clostridium sp. YIM B02505]|uniref:Lipoprotein n=1 Tax=Clostridium yunnanense TaxID=2800325 RepID=A0ABS1EV61_9CLOT|nr:hypothetical protein [Clostridium yunnanense]MBK1813183.1 hypothetical protein [Clostridium yunnanense]
MKRHLASFLTILLILLPILFGCTRTSKNLNTNEELQTNESSTSDNADIIDISDYNKHASINTLGYVLELLDENSKELKNNCINTTFGGDVKLVVDAKYFAEPVNQESINYALTVYLDYRQVEFSINNTKLKRYTSKSKNDMSNKISLTIPTISLTGSHRLLIVSQINDYVGEGFPGSICKSIDINIGKETSYELTGKKSIGKNITSPKAYIDQGQVIVNRNFIVETDPNKGIDLPPQIFKAKKDKSISLALRFPQSDNGGLLFLTLNSEQIPIDDQQYLYFSDIKNPMFKKVTIKTPEKSGEYTLNAYFVHAPWEKTSDLTAVSNSIKLIVE